MPCSKVSISKNYKCDKAGCICIPTGGKPCICVCENEYGDIMRCDDCKCSNSDTCQCKCDDSKCTCIVTKGADCVCVCRDEKGNYKTCDCCCNEAKETTCCKKVVSEKSRGCCDEKSFSGKDGCGSICKCDSKKEYKQSPRCVTVNKNYKCDTAGCVCIPTDGKSCICVCENENGDIMRCDDCKCSNSDTCQCKCDDSKCTCIVTKGVDCVCVCRDERGNFKTCDCCCIEDKETPCCTKKVCEKPRRCHNKALDKEGCGTTSKCDGKKYFTESRRAVNVFKNYKCAKAECVCLPAGGKSCICVCENENGDIIQCDDCKCIESGHCKYNCDDSKCTCIATKGSSCICVCRDKKGNLTTCDCCCIEPKETTCCKKEVRDVKSRGCCNESSFSEKDARGSICKCDCKKEFKQSSRRVTIMKNYKCDKPGCVCIPTEGKSCICVCEDENGDIMRCDDCKCCKSDTHQCKCDDSNCTCIITNGADCVCVCQDGKGNFEVCDCCCETKDTSCSKKEVNVTYECYNKKPEKQIYNCQCDNKNKVKEFMECDKAGYSYSPTGGKPYVRRNEDNSNAFLCQSLSRKCCSNKLAYNKEPQNITYRYADCKGHKNMLSSKNEEPNCMFKNNIQQKSNSDRSTKPIKFSCCNYDKNQDNKNIDAKPTCVCVSRATRCRYVSDADCLYVTKKVTTSCLCCY